jgi:hypothetical protein
MGLQTRSENSKKTGSASRRWRREQERLEKKKNKMKQEIK